MRGKPGSSPKSAWQAVELRRGAGQLHSNGQGLLRWTARDLLRELDPAAGPDEPEIRETLRDLIAAVEARE